MAFCQPLHYTGGQTVMNGNENMSELNEKLWAVISERGPEQTHLSYAEAVRLVSQLQAEKIRGLNVVSHDAAARLQEYEEAAQSQVKS